MNTKALGAWHGVFLFMILSIGGCVTPRAGGIRYEPPKSAFRSTDPTEETVLIVGINDFHGSLLPKERKLPDGRTVQSGGASALAGMLRVLKEESGGRLLIVDAGDEWQGTIESNQVKGASVVEFFNRIGVSAAAVGNHEFDFGIPSLGSRFAEAKYPYLSANIFEKSSGKRVVWPNFHSSKIFDVQGYQIGIAGFSTVQTPSTTRYEFVKHLEFRDPVSSVGSEVAELRSQGAHAVLVTAHAGTICEEKHGLREWRIHDRNSVQGRCDEEHEIPSFLKGVDQGSVDGVVAGHTHQVIHHFLRDVPVVQGEAYNQYFNIIYLVFDRSTRKLKPEKTRIEGLIPICSQFFEGYDHCDVRRLDGKQSPRLVQAVFHGKTVSSDPVIEAWLKPIREGTEKFRKEVLATSELPLTHFRDREGAFGNLLSDVLRQKGKADFALVNSGGIRTALDAGEITYDGLFRALPFDNLLNVVELTGAQVKLLYRIATSGAHGVVGVSGLELTLVPFEQEVPKDDLNGNGKLESWEARRLIHIRGPHGEELEDSKMYRVATFDFLVNGGDDLGWFFSQIPERSVRREQSGYCRDLVTEFLKREKRINTREHPLLNPERPRIRFVPRGK
jgi:5'-nucleotidase